MRLKTALYRYWLPSVGLLVGGFLLGGAAATKGVFSGEMAAWVQGLGTVAAIVAAAWVSGEQWRRERQRRQDAWAASVNDIIDIIQYARASSAQLRSAVEDQRKDDILAGVHAWNDTGADEVLDRLLQMPIEIWPSPLTFVRVRRYTLAMREMIQLAVTPGGLGVHAAMMKHPKLRKLAGEVTTREDQALANLGALEFQER